MVRVEGGIDTSNDAVFTLVLDVLDRKKETHTSLVLTPQDLLRSCFIQPIRLYFSESIHSRFY